ncbi:MAG TPA: TSUP family transporter [Rhabdaerophilum sp.]|nr:TSUP family transporter [Rhabdaerophilum sp.]
MPEFQLALDLVALLVLAALAAGFVDAIAGGVGLITVPALLLAGIPPVAAIATNKLQGTFGVASSTLAFWRAGRIERAYLVPFFGAAFAGGVAGAAVAHLVPDPVLRVAIPVALVAIAIFVLLSPKLGDADAKPRMGIMAFALTFGVGNGAYDGAFGPGAGTFFLLCGFAMMRAVAHTRLMNFGSNLGSLLFFLYAGHVLVPLGLAMGLASACGAYLGARTTMRFGAGLIRPLVVVVSLAMAFRLLIDPSNPLGAWLRSL